VIFASGADHIADLVQPGVPCFEYRHAPDPGALENVLVPYLAELRRDKIAGNETQKPVAADLKSKTSKARGSETAPASQLNRQGTGK